LYDRKTRSTGKVTACLFSNIYHETHLLLTHLFVYKNIVLCMILTSPQPHPFPHLVNHCFFLVLNPQSQVFFCQIFFSCCFATTQPAPLVHQERTQVVCSNKVARKHLARRHSRNGPWTHKCCFEVNVLYVDCVFGVLYLEIIIDLPFGFPINNIISLWGVEFCLEVLYLNIYIACRDCNYLQYL